MKHKEGSKVTKGMIFAGCSFTWGQGLYYYSGLKTLREPPPDAFNKNLLTEAHVKYMESVRFPRIVSNKMRSFDIVYPGNGGSNEGVVKWWEACIYRERYHSDRMNDYEVNQIYPSEISHFIFQFTQWGRDHVLLKDVSGEYDIEFNQALNPEYREMFLNKISKEGKTLDDFIENHIDESYVRVKNLLMELERDGIKILIMTWPDEYLDRIKSDDWAKEKLVTFNYKGNHYDSINKLMNIRSNGNLVNPEMTIKYDFENFTDPPKDHHPSLSCHRLLAESILKKINFL